MTGYVSTTYQTLLLLTATTLSGICDDHVVYCHDLGNNLATQSHGVMGCSGLRHLFSMRVCTLWTKSRAIIKTCGTSCRSAISKKRS